jgi:hypothetical protein
MRLFYGAWPWETNKTWYRTRQAVAYVESLRTEKKLRQTEDAEDNNKKGAIKDEAGSDIPELFKDEAQARATLRQLLNSTRDSGDTFDRSHGDSAPEGSAQSPKAGTAQKSD